MGSPGSGGWLMKSHDAEGINPARTAHSGATPLTLPTGPGVLLVDGVAWVWPREPGLLTQSIACRDVKRQGGGEGLLARGRRAHL